MRSPGSKLPDVGTTIFTVMSRLAAETGAVNLGQGFPDFQPPVRLRELLAQHLAAGHNQYAPMTGVPALRRAIADKVAACHGVHYDADAEITVTAGATQALMAAMLLRGLPGVTIAFVTVIEQHANSSGLQSVVDFFGLGAGVHLLAWDVHQIHVERRGGLGQGQAFVVVMSLCQREQNIFKIFRQRNGR